MSIIHYKNIATRIHCKRNTVMYYLLYIYISASCKHYFTKVITQMVCYMKQSNRYHFQCASEVHAMPTFMFYGRSCYTKFVHKCCMESHFKF